MSDHQHILKRTSLTMSAPSKPKLAFCIFSCTAVLFLLTNSASAFAGSGEVKTAQQLRTRGQSAEQFRPRVLAENLVMMTKTSPVVPAGVTEAYRVSDRLQVIAPTNATIFQSNASSPTATAEVVPEMTGGNRWAWRLKKVVQSQGFQKMIMGNFMDMKTKKWKPTGNDLWDGLITDCIQNPSFSCMQKNMYSYLDRTLMAHDLNVTDSFLLIKNQVNYTDELIQTNEIDGNEDSTRLDNDLDAPNGRSLNDEDDTTEAGE